MELATVTRYSCVGDSATSNHICSVDAEASFKRSDDGMNRLVPFVSDDVKLRIQMGWATRNQ